MKQYICSVCGYVYDEEKGIPDGGIGPGTRWDELPDHWRCPWCGADKGAFLEKGAAAVQGNASELEADALPEEPEVLKELSAMEMSVICSNLSRGCEKQYQEEAARGFAKLAQFFRGQTQTAEKEAEKEAAAEEAAKNGAEEAADAAENALCGALQKLVRQDLERNYPYANAAAGKSGDRGALRSLVWSEKVTRMLDSLLKRYEQEGEAMLANTGVYVCTICGFVYVGDSAPELCPVCKVPGWKFEKAEGRMA